MLRVCTNGHLTGTKNCWCGEKAQRLLQDRQAPVPLHPKSAQANRLRAFRRSGVWQDLPEGWVDTEFALLEKVCAAIEQSRLETAK